MTQLFLHPRLGRVRVVHVYSDMWTVVAESDGEIDSVVPATLTPLGGPAQAALPEVVNVQVEVVRQQIDINHCTPAELSDAVDGIGKARAAKILSRRPEGGYRDLAHVESLNGDIGLNWADVAEQDVILFREME